VTIGPTAEQIGLRDAIRDALAQRCPMTLVRQTMSEPPLAEPLWGLAVELGWTQLARRGSTADDLGLTTLDMVLAMEECGTVLVPVPMVTSVGMAAAPLLAGGEPVRDALSAIADGEVATLAVHQRGHRLPTVPTELSHGKARGIATSVPDADRAKNFVTLCRRDTDGVICVAVVPRDQVHITTHESVDPTRPIATVEFDSAPECVAEVDFDTALAPALLAQAAELVGVAKAVLGLAVEHAKTRTQFGKPIGAFQGVKHELANIQVAVERARSLTYVAAAVIDQAAPGSRPWTSAALAKAAAGEAAVDSARAAIQVLGALGQTWEHDAHLYLRRAWLGFSLLGDTRALYHLEGARYLREVS
jgi:alkylation response protein AidB-like acyl-CoA dehydrogenase